MEQLPKSFYDTFTRMEKVYPESVAVQYYDEGVVKITYRQYHDDISRFTAYLQDHKIPARSHIALLAKNSYSYLVALHAIILSDCVTVPINPDLSKQDIQQVLEDADVSVLLYDEYFMKRAEMTLRDGMFICLDIRGYSNYSCVSLCDLCDINKLCMILFTSGSTGKNKGVMFNQMNMLASMNIYSADAVETMRSIGCQGFRVNQITLLPLYHVAAILEGFECAFVGSVFSLCLDVRNLLRDVHIMKSHFIALPPVLVEYVLKQSYSKPAILQDFQVICSAAAAANPDVILELQQKGVIVKQIYAMTETFAVGTFNHSQDRRYIASVGKGDPSMEYMFIDGELCVRGDCVMMGYYRDTDATSAAMDEDGWFHTGDLGTKDENGYFYITGRKKNLIILDNGENVSPEELERLLKECSMIEDVIVCEKEKKICADIFCKEENQSQIKDYIHSLNQTLPRYKQIALIAFSNEPLGRSALGKEVRNN